MKKKICTVCQIEPAVGYGVGKIKSTCVTCMNSMIAEGTCPACRGVETYSAEHILVCDGKRPKVKHVQRKGKRDGVDVKSPSEILKEVGASERMADRRAAAAARKKMTPEERLAYRKELEAQAEEAKAEGNTNRLTKVQEKLAIEDAVPVDRCAECGCFLADNGKCVNEDCALVKAG